MYTDTATPIFQVIHFIEDGILLQKPDRCPSTLYHIMLGCWRSNPKDRYVLAYVIIFRIYMYTRVGQIGYVYHEGGTHSVNREF